ncbi:unnamed protein product [marine sediment metagenome]|uniref:Uncharacterized protein n=1 Tax=marine sediment metagenome TaxID=412755 RepID=X1C6J7_9ZZZZ
MPELVEIIKYRCMECNGLYSKLEDAELCEAADIFKKFLGKIPVEETTWRKMEPKCSKPTKKWIAWSNYGLACGW